MADNYERPENDFYPTPSWCIEELLKIIEISKLVEIGWTFGEPCKGSSNAILNLLPENSLWMELEEGRDYLTDPWSHYYPHRTLDCIITNPPFRLALEFLRKSLEEAPVCIYLLRLGFLGSKKRHSFHKENSPDHLIVCSQRPKFKNNGSENSEYAWFIYDKHNKLGLKKHLYFIKE